MRKRVQNLPSGKKTKTDANNKIKNRARRQENQQAPMITTKGRTMNRLTELKQKTLSFSLRNRCSNETKTRSRRVILPLLLLSTLFWVAGCEDYHSSSPGYFDPAAYDAANPADFLGHDRLYYRGPGYRYGRIYYAWEPGYWAYRTGVSPSRGPGLAGPNGALGNPGQLLWIHGRYIARGY